MTARTIDDLDGLLLREPWRQHAACARYDSHLFFPDRGGTTQPARAICAHCTAQPGCLDYAVRTCQVFGVWGGTDYRERQHIRMGRLNLDDVKLMLRKAAGAWTRPTC